MDAPGSSRTGSTATGNDASYRLVSVIQELSMARSLEDVQGVVRHAARELTGADGATFVLRDGEQCHYADEDAIEPLWKGKRFPMSACISGWTMLNRVPAIIEDIFQDPRVPVDAYKPTFVRSLAMVPIRTKAPVGAIGNYWARPHLASQEEVRLLQALADSTSIAIENVTLLKDLRDAKEAAEVASRLRDEFLATVSHELRTPLNPILGWTNLLLEETLTASEMREAVTSIQEGAMQELRHVEALLDVSRIIAGRMRVDLAEASLETIVEAAIESASPAARAKNIRIDFDRGHDLPLVRIDGARFQQVAWNLLSNAVKFTPESGGVQVTLACSSPARSAISLVVTDTGEGIEPGFAPHLFRRFRQEDGTSTRSAGGMGLGLAMVRHLVELHGGTVHAESPGKGLGSTFTVTLPLAGGGHPPVSPR
jgi:two-component system CheB/CheR fusion protein